MDRFDRCLEFYDLGIGTTSTFAALWLSHPQNFVGNCQMWSSCLLSNICFGWKTINAFTTNPVCMVLGDSSTRHLTSHDWSQSKHLFLQEELHAAELNLGVIILYGEVTHLVKPPKIMRILAVPSSRQIFHTHHDHLRRKTSASELSPETRLWNSFHHKVLHPPRFKLV